MQTFAVGISTCVTNNRQEKKVKADDEVEPQTLVESIAGGTKKVVLDMMATKRLSKCWNDKRMKQKIRRQISDHENKQPSKEDLGRDDVQLSQISMDSERDRQVSDEEVVGCLALSVENINR